MRTKLVKRYRTILRGPSSNIHTNVLPIYVHMLGSRKVGNFLTHHCAFYTVGPLVQFQRTVDRRLLLNEFVHALTEDLF